MQLSRFHWRYFIIFLLVVVIFGIFHAGISELILRSLQKTSSLAAGIRNELHFAINGCSYRPEFFYKLKSVDVQVVYLDANSPGGYNNCIPTQDACGTALVDRFSSADAVKLYNSPLPDALQPTGIVQAFNIHLNNRVPRTGLKTDFRPFKACAFPQTNLVENAILNTEKIAVDKLAIVASIQKILVDKRRLYLLNIDTYRNEAYNQGSFGGPWVISDAITAQSLAEQFHENFY